MYLPGIEQIVQSVDPSVRDAVRKHRIETHTDVNVIPKVAKNANAKRVAMTHYIPGFTPASVYVKTAKEAAGRIGYAGEILAPADLDVVLV